MACIIVTLCLNLNNCISLKLIVSLTITSGSPFEPGKYRISIASYLQSFKHTLQFCVTTKLSRGILLFIHFGDLHSLETKYW